VPRELTAIILAVVSAVFIAVGIVVRQRSTMGVPEEHSVSGAMATALVRQPLWWAGTAVAVGGYMFQALALSKGSLLLVQPVLVSSLLFALPLSARLSHRRVTRSEWMWAVVLTVAIAAFVVVGNPRPGHARPPGPAWAAVAVVAVPLVVLCVLGAARQAGRRRAVLLAVAVAVLFAVVAVLTKASVFRLAHGGVPHLLSTPTPYVLAVVALAATVLQQSAFHAGALQVSVPTMIVLEPLVAVTIGIAVLGEHLTVGGPGVVGLAISVVAMVVATVALARDAALHEEELHPSVMPIRPR